MIRAAATDDIPRLLELGALMHAESPNFRDMRFCPQKLAAAIGRAIDGGFACVLEVDGQVVGGLLAVLFPHWFSPDLVACDLALFIEPAHRGGAGAARLLNAYRAWGREAGAVKVQFGITTGVRPEATEALAVGLGWRRVGVVMEA